MKNVRGGRPSSDKTCCSRLYIHNVRTLNIDFVCFKEDPVTVFGLIDGRSVDLSANGVCDGNLNSVFFFASCSIFKSLCRESFET